MNVLIAGGSGFLGRALTKHLTNHHTVFVLTRQTPKSSNQIQWDGRTSNGWAHRLNEMDAVINLTGYGLEHWPWTQRQKQRFVDSRVIPGLALAAAFEQATHRPGIFIQASGINRYGLRGEGIADESTPPADDFLGVYLPKLLSLSLRESGVDADNEDLDGLVMAIDLVERSRT